MRERLLSGLGAGVAATLLMTGVGFLLPALPWELRRVLNLLADRPLWLLLVVTAHLSYGGLAGALFFGGSRRVTWGGGALFGLALWGVAVALYSPLLGWGFVASHRPGLALLALPAHLLYGLTLAAFAPRGEILQPT